ncbi:MAG TPA: NAD(P)/FAD-dependent oxidoreductase, partial [Candidatus Anaerobutyricum stercoripullorum]|nr:NAD(P)/FAD-dependent oxidoreductase [Candidatus Anaerobutyricum stercoripullorum]
EEQECAREQGELQWTDYGVSGVAVFQLSRFAILALEEGKRVRLSLDFLPEKAEEETVELLRELSHCCGYKTGTELLDGILPAKLTPVLLREAAVDEKKKASRWDEKEIRRLASALKAFSLRISGYVGYEKAQVTRGGVDLRELTGQLESVICPGLFFAGEVLDVDGTCGGYNLQWAFSSGSVAGKAAYERNRRMDSEGIV